MAAARFGIKTLVKKRLLFSIDLETEADAGGPMSARGFADLLGALLAQGEVRDRDAPRSGIMIWGTLEARVQGARFDDFGWFE